MKKKPLTLVRDQRVRFLIVGGINTLLGFGLFAFFEVTLGERFGSYGYMVSLMLSYAVAISIAFLLHKRFVFKTHGHVWLDFGRFILSNCVGLGLNAILLPTLVTLAGFSPIWAQGVTTFIVAVSSYVLHKYFSFRRNPTDSNQPDVAR